MSAPNIRTARESCLSACVPRDHSDPGDVHRCAHGRIWMCGLAFTGDIFWNHLNPFWHPIRYRRAKAALGA